MIPEKTGEFYLKVWYNYNDLRKYRERAREDVYKRQAQDHAVIAGIQLGEGVLHLGLGELAGRLHAPAGEHFIGVVVVMMMTCLLYTSTTKCGQSCSCGTSRT